MTFFKPKDPSRWHRLSGSGVALCGRCRGQGTMADEIPDGAQECRVCARLARRANPGSPSEFSLDLERLHAEIMAHGGLEWVGKRAGLCGNTLRKWIQRGTEPGVLCLARVCAVCGVPVGSIIKEGNSGGKQA